MTSLHDVAPRLAAARDVRRVELATGTTAYRATKLATRRCTNCGGVADGYGLTLVDPRPASERDGPPMHPLRGLVGRCRSCGTEWSTLAVHVHRVAVPSDVGPQALRAFRGRWV